MYLPHHNPRRYYMKKQTVTDKPIPSASPNSVSVNRQYKDTVFRMLFSDRNNLLALYNAVSGCNYTDAEKLTIVTLENAIYLGMKNDLAFVLDMSIYLYEHQSTVNPNIPLRDLFYISAEYNNLVKDESLYSSALKKIPAPRFFVFYNGTDLQADRLIYRLSDAYLSKVSDSDLELKVTVLNINAGHNAELMSECEILRECSLYVSKIRANMKLYNNLDTAVNQSIDECISEGILSDFLRKNRAEVIMTSIFEYNKEEEERKLRSAEREAGYADGLAQGEINGELRGKFNMLIQLVNNNVISAADAAKQINITEEEFVEKMKESK